MRRTTFYPLISESLDQTRGKPRSLRRALAFAHLLDNVEQVVLPHELLAGSITGMWPLAGEQASLEQHLGEARTVIGEYLQQRRHAAPSRPVERWALMARDHYDARIRFADLQRVAQQLAQELDNGNRIPYAELYRVLENHFVFDYGEHVRNNFAELPWFAANHLSLSFRKALGAGLGGLRQQIVQRRSQAAGPAPQEFYDSALVAMDAAIRFIHRYAATLRQEAERSARGARPGALRHGGDL